ncbi:MAG: alanine--tRNA ligase [Coriobacteriia bacterium]|nr:alanine--tRNA ligase [Coriobacteriia bacterium]MCL2536696.1 alanine--tRNA ligase [Coriobacteriia bacterium]
MNPPVSTADIREQFLSFFEQRGATRLPSSSLIPDDPSLLLTAAGMVQFKPIFLGAKKPDTLRATTAQKCVRTTDIDIIGTTGRHLSFFEMMGNFSFGDYFKREAIAWAWEFSTEVLGLDPERIYATAFRDDDEAVELWLQETSLPADRVRRFDEADNFWAAGPTGPCGPCAELFYDRGEAFGCDSPDCTVGCECDRFVEYWNLVFMQYNRDKDGVLHPLPKKSVDTGMGLERMAAIMQDVPTNYDIDLMRALIAVAEDCTNSSYTGAVVPSADDVSLRIIADHARSVAFMIADGVLPANEGRGYVLRRLLRKAVLNGHKLGHDEAFLLSIVDKVIELMSDHYRELSTHKDLIAGIVTAEEESFLQTLTKGLKYLDEGLTQVPEGGELSGEAAFKLHDTYGFPIDLTLEVCAEKGYRVDREGFESCMKQQKERARAQVQDVSWSTFGGSYTDILKEFGPTYFEGYAKDRLEAAVLAIIDGEGKQGEQLQEGEAGEVILDYTPFYAEQGGQVGDTGTITTPSGAVFSVSDTQVKDGLIIHKGQMKAGKLAVEEGVEAAIDVDRRSLIRRNHTATHLLHWALREVVGSHVTQAGSLVTDTRLRFDFTHFERLTSSQLTEIEELVNQKISDDLPVRAFTTTLAEAQDLGVTALFGEKYGEYVRVLEIGTTSKELCGGTHIGRSSEIGLFKIVAEESVGANLRRIEAVTSMAAYRLTRSYQNELEAAAALLKAQPKDLCAKVENLLENQRKLKVQLKAAVEAGPVGKGTEALLEDAFDAGGYQLAIASPDDVATADLRKLWDRLRQAGIDAAVIVTADKESGKAIYMAAANDKATTAGFHAGNLVKDIAASLDGRGGGKPGMAQGGADPVDPARLEEVITELRARLA